MIEHAEEKDTYVSRETVMNILFPVFYDTGLSLVSGLVAVMETFKDRLNDNEKQAAVQYFLNRYSR